MTSLTAAFGLLPAALANSIGSQAQKPLAIVVVGAMLCTLFLTRYLMPVLYSFFPAPAGTLEAGSGLVAGSHYTDRFLERDHRPGGGNGHGHTNAAADAAEQRVSGNGDQGVQDA
jgi:cobalt-zinc-cadmium resistance protein CzcA